MDYYNLAPFTSASCVTTNGTTNEHSSLLGEGPQRRGAKVPQGTSVDDTATGGGGGDGGGVYSSSSDASMSCKRLFLFYY